MRILSILVAVVVLTACGDSGGPTDSEVTQWVKRDEASRGYNVSAVKGISCRAERGNADLFTCQFKIVRDRGREQFSSACFRDLGGRWDFSGNGRNCHAFRR